MTRELLKDSSGAKVYVDRGESAILTATMYDTGAGTLAKADISTLAFTLVDARSGVTINSRSNQNVLDANDGTVSTAGVLTLKLGPADNIICNPSLEDYEPHYCTLAWTWVDSDGDTLTGKQQWEIRVLNSP